METTIDTKKAPEKVPDNLSIISAFKQRGFEYNKEFGLGYNDKG